MSAREERHRLMRRERARIDALVAAMSDAELDESRAALEALETAIPKLGQAHIPGVPTEAGRHSGRQVLAAAVEEGLWRLWKAQRVMNGEMTREEADDDPTPGVAGAVGRDGRARLLFGPYTPPPLKPGDRAFCLYRKCEVVITGWTDALIPWPRCHTLGSAGGSGLLVEQELARAVRHESAAAVMYWWRASEYAVQNWRRALGIPPAGDAAARAAAPGYDGALWSPEELALLGAVPDEQVARRTGRTLSAVRVKRGRLGIRCPAANRWTAEQIALLGTRPDSEVARLVGRSAGAVVQKRVKLGIAEPSGERRAEGLEG